MTRKMIVLTTLILAIAGTTSGGELKGRVKAPQGKTPAVLFLKGVSGGTLPKTDTVITHRSGGAFQPAPAGR